MEQFEHEGHLAVVLQLMKCDLRMGLRKYGQGNGLPLPFVLTFARDIFLALRALRSIKVVHTDLKPDNLLISLDRTCVKLSDFGSAMDTNQTAQVYTDYLQPRFYRAPEVILGLTYGTEIDMWSLGCVLVEMHMGQPLFPGKCSHDQMGKIIEILGLPPSYMVTKAPSKQRRQFFEVVSETEDNIQYRFRPLPANKSKSRSKSSSDSSSSSSSSDLSELSSVAVVP